MRSEYQEERFRKMLAGKKSAGTKRDEDRKRGQWFADQIRRAPVFCQECGTRLSGTMAINPAAIVAHILPKRENGGCPSIAAFEANVVFLCIDCHTNMDNLGREFVIKMNLYQELKRRVSILLPHIAPAEHKNIPEWLL